MSGYARWAAVLAGGDGTRLRPFTKRLAGDDRPKQFCRILSQSTLLGETINRVAYTVQPASTVFVVARDHEPFYRKDLADVRASHIVAQPVSRGTTAAVALALTRIDHLACPEPIVGFFPADHSYEDARPLRMALEQAYTMATGSPDRLVLVGARATGPDTDYGWIQPGEVIVKDRMRGPKRLPIHQVRGFVEKPSSDVAEGAVPGRRVVEHLRRDRPHPGVHGHPEGNGARDLESDRGGGRHASRARLPAAPIGV